MSIDTPKDLEGITAAAALVGDVLTQLVARVEPGITTGTLDALAAGLVRAAGGRSAPAVVYGFPRTVLISVNDEIVHGIPGPRRLGTGDIVSIDVTLELDGYVADAARSMVVGAGEPRAHALVACAEAAFEAALAVARAGVRVSEIGRAVERTVTGAGFAVVGGLCGHGVGRSIHEPPDVPNEWTPGQPDVLTDGLVITIEPMITTGSRRCVQDADGWTLRTDDGSLAAHYEETLVITRDRPIVLTRAAA